ncbi:MAG: alpha/beta hydrolase [Lachnospiraceae bacterium]
MKKNIKNFVLLASIATLIIHIMNRIIDNAAAIKNILKADKGHFYNWRYGNVYYTKEGSGKPLLLIHDLQPECSNYEWKNVVQELSRTNTVYTIDLLGCGRSDRPNLTYTNFLYVELLRDFIKHVIGEKTTMVSTGDSSSITIMSCNMDPEQYEKLILINPTELNQLTKMPSKRKNTLKFFLDLPIIGTLIYNLEMQKSRLAFKYEKSYKNYSITEDVIDACYEAAHKNKSSGKYLFSSIRTNYTNINIIHALKNINQSICIISSMEKDDYLDIEEEYLFYNPAIECVHLKDTKGLPQLETPRKLVETIHFIMNS